MSSAACSQTTEKSLDAVAVWRGWTAPAAGYYLSVDAMRDTVAGWREARQLADVRAQALDALRAEINAQQADLKNQLRQLNAEISAERAAWRGRVRRGKLQGFACGLLLGFGGGYLVRRNNP